MFLLVKCIFATKKTRKYDNAEKLFFDSVLHQKNRLLKNGEAPIGLRITVNGQRAELQIKRSVPEKQWNAAKGCAIGKDRKTLELNQYLEMVRTKVYQIYRELSQDDKPINAEILKVCSTVKVSLPKCCWKYSVTITKSIVNLWARIMWKELSSAMSVQSVIWRKCF